MKIVFKYGVMNSGKTLDMVGRVHSLREKDNKVLVMKPELDTRSHKVKSRSGMSVDTDMYISNDNNNEEYDHLVFEIYQFVKPDFIFIDEGQFVNAEFVDALINRFYKTDVVVVVYGLMKDFMGNLFEGTIKWLSVCDKIFEIETQCEHEGCHRKATYNILIKDGNIVRNDDEIVQIGDSQYKGVCLEHFHKED